MINERLESALKWCDKHKIKNQLKLYNRVEEKGKKLSKKDKGGINGDKSLRKGAKHKGV